MAKRVTVTLELDDEIWPAAKDLIRDELGMSASGFVRIVLRTLLASKKRPLQQVIEGLATSLLEEARMMSKK